MHRAGKVAWAGHHPPCRHALPRSNPPSRGGDVPSPWPPLATQNFLGRDVPAPIHTLNYFGAGDVPSPHLPRLRNPLGRDVPAPTRSVNYFGAGDVPSPHLPRPCNVRHQFGTSPGLLRPVLKTLKGFQTVAGGKAARPPPPVPRPQNVQPPPLAEGVGGGGTPESPQAVSPDESRCSAIPRRRQKAQRGSATGEPGLPGFTAESFQGEATTGKSWRGGRKGRATAPGRRAGG